MFRRWVGYAEFRFFSPPRFYLPSRTDTHEDPSSAKAILSVYRMRQRGARLRAPRPTELRPPLDSPHGSSSRNARARCNHCRSRSSDLRKARRIAIPRAEGARARMRSQLRRSSRENGDKPDEKKIIASRSRNTVKTKNLGEI